MVRPAGIQYAMSGRVRFAYFNGGGPGVAELVLTEHTAGGKLAGQDVTFRAEYATFPALNAVRDRWVEFRGRGVYLNGRRVADVTGTVIQFMPF